MRKLPNYKYSQVSHYLVREFSFSGELKTEYFYLKNQ